MYVMSGLIVLRMNCDYVLMVIFKINLASQSKIVNLMECMTVRSHGQEIDRKCCSDCDLIGEEGINEFVCHLTELRSYCNVKKEN